MILRLSILVAIMLSLAVAARADPQPPLKGMLRAPALWEAYKAAFVSPGGRVIDNANGGVSHSEGQGYGMLLALAADDRETFERIWSWTRAQLMLREDGLAAWRWRPDATPHVADRNNATDGDLLIAWALAEAGEAWSAPAYKTGALQIAQAIGATTIADSRFGPVLKPAVQGFGPKDRPDGPVVNLSYWVFPALLRLGALQPDQPWKPLIHSGVALAKAARFGPVRLPSDWISIRGAEPAPAAGFPATFGYDAIRVPLYLLWAGMTDKAVLAPYRKLFADPAAAPWRVDVTSGKGVEELADSGYRAISALANCALTGARLPPIVSDAAVDRYYPTTLRLMVLVAVNQRYAACR